MTSIGVSYGLGLGFFCIHSAFSLIVLPQEAGVC